jgi:hypothetical protein
MYCGDSRLECRLSSVGCQLSTGFRGFVIWDYLGISHDQFHIFPVVVNRLPSHTRQYEMSVVIYAHCVTPRKWLRPSVTLAWPMPSLYRYVCADAIIEAFPGGLGDCVSAKSSVGMLYVE